MQEPEINITAFRKANGLSQVQLAKILGISAAYLSALETNKDKKPPKDKIDIILGLDNYDKKDFNPILSRLEFAIQEGRKLYGKDYTIPDAQFIDNVRYAQSGISLEWATLIASDIPTINPLWLSDGIGSPFIYNKTISENAAELFTRLSVLEKEHKSAPAWRDLYHSAVTENAKLKQIITEKDKQIETLNKLINNG